MVLFSPSRPPTTSVWAIEIKFHGLSWAFYVHLVFSFFVAQFSAFLRPLVRIGNDRHCGDDERCRVCLSLVWQSWAAAPFQMSRTITREGDLVRPRYPRIYHNIASVFTSSPSVLSARPQSALESGFLRSAPVTWPVSETLPGA